MPLLSALSDDALWREFLHEKTERGHLTKPEIAELTQFIESKSYAEYADRITRNGYVFDPPAEKHVNKKGTPKKRTVYCFPAAETIVMKFLAWRLHKYDRTLAPNCFSFRRDFSVRGAVSALIGQIKNKQFCCYKLDIQNYFNSIDTALLLPKLKTLFADDAALYIFFEKFLTQTPDRGAMAGTPTSPFLANVFLAELDAHFYKTKIPYARYSDDIIVFARTESELTAHKDHIADTLAALHLTINKSKEATLPAGVPWSFLGVEYNNGAIDLSQITIEKIKAKIRRKARAINRWRHAKRAAADKAAAVMIRAFNKKFFDDACAGELTWCRWYFPLLTADKGLHTVDKYLQDWLRFLITNRHVGTNNKTVPYAKLKELGYISLLHRFHEST